jgi:hypothetical protein
MGGILMKSNLINKIIKFFTLFLLVITTNIKATNQSLEFIEKNQKELFSEINTQVDTQKRISFETKILKTDFLKTANSLFSKEQFFTPKTFLDSDTLKNLNIFNNAQDAENTLFNKIDKTRTGTGSLTLAQMIANPPAKIEDLQTTQEIIKTLCANPTRLEELDTLLIDFSQAEEDFLKIFSQYSNISAEEILQKLEKDLVVLKQDKRCGSFLNALKNRLLYYKNTCINMWNNKTATLAQALFFYYPTIFAYLNPVQNPTIGYYNPTFWITLLINFFDSNPMTALIFMYMVGIQINDFFSLAVPFMAGGLTLKETGTVLKETFWDNPAKQKLIETKFKEYAKNCAQLLEKTQKIYELISEEKFFKEIINDCGTNDNDKISITNHLITIGKLDAYMSLAKLHLYENYCLVNFTKEPQPYIKFIALKSPLNSEKILDVEIAEKISQNFSLQEISTAIILAHLGVALAQEAVITPLKYMHASAQLNMLTIN